jgi:hypothetical protein
LLHKFPFHHCVLLTTTLPDQLKGSLPTIEELEAELSALASAVEDKPST